MTVCWRVAQKNAHGIRSVSMSKCNAGATKQGGDPQMRNGAERVSNIWAVLIALACWISDLSRLHLARNHEPYLCPYR